MNGPYAPAHFPTHLPGVLPALMRSRRKRPLVLLDVRLPVMEGFEVLEQLQADSQELRKIPILILSNYGDARMIRRGLELGAREYLVKSATTPSTLAAKVKELLPRGAPHL